MSDYRRGAVLGLTVAETFILLTFLLLVAMLGLTHGDEPLPKPDTANPPQGWVRPEEIKTLVNAAKQARAAAERERDQAHEEAEEARKAQAEAEQAHAAVERELNQTRRELALLRRKGKNPPCWYQIVSAGEGKTREKRYYAFNVAIHEDSIELAPRTAPPGGAFDDGDEQ